MCLYPKLIINPKYKPNKKNGGHAPPITDQRVKYVPIGCKQCMECKKQKAKEWQVRLSEDIKHNKNAHFITLTFSNESIKEITEKIYTKLEGINCPEGYDLDNAIATYAVRHWLENIRASNKKSTRHWLITELGQTGTEHIHIHGIIWTSNPNEVLKKWIYGHTFKGSYVNERTINYIIKYVNKTDQKHPRYNQIILTSPGIGAGYKKSQDIKKNKFNGKDTIETYRNRKGYKLALPIYYRNHVYTDQEREQLWLNKLDKQERWVLGNKIDISNGEEAYYLTLKAAQNKNKQLGYAYPKKDEWAQLQYEKQTRSLRQHQRIKAAKN